jgi:AcrR family transcriptional regulator
LLRAWQELVAEEGEEQATIRSVAARADVSVGTVYEHFKDREDLNNEAALRCYQNLAEDLEQMRVGYEGSVLEYVRTAVGVLVRFTDEHPTDARFLYRMAAASANAGSPFFQSWQTYWNDNIGAFVRAAPEELARDFDLGREVAGQAFWGMGEKVMLWWLDNKERIDREELIDVLTNMMVRAANWEPDAAK